MRENDYHLTASICSDLGPDNKCITYVCEDGYCNLFKVLKKQDTRIDDYYEDSMIINGHLRFYKTYDGYFDYYIDAELLIKTTHVGHFDMVRYIVLLFTVNTQIAYNTLYVLIKEKYLDIIQLILEDDTFHMFSYSIMNLMLCHDIQPTYKAMKVLLNFDVSNDQKIKFLKLCNQDYNVVKLLLKSGIDMRDVYGDILEYFKQYSTPGIVELLIKSNLDIHQGLYRM
jgi:hypothetical protein